MKVSIPHDLTLAKHKQLHPLRGVHGHTPVFPNVYRNPFILPRLGGFKNLPVRVFPTR